jgi:hypothetical protein
LLGLPLILLLPGKETTAKAKEQPLDEYSD